MFFKLLIFFEISHLEKVIESIGSVHNNHYEDRVYSIECKYTCLKLGASQWSGYVNNFDKSFTYNCPENYVVTGKILHKKIKQEYFITAKHFIQ